MVAVDYDRDEEEGDDSNSFSFSKFIPSIDVLPCGNLTSSISPVPVILVRATSREHRFRLRC